MKVKVVATHKGLGQPGSGYGCNAARLSQVEPSVSRKSFYAELSSLLARDSIIAQSGLAVNVQACIPHAVLQHTSLHLIYTVCAPDTEQQKLVAIAGLAVECRSGRALLQVALTTGPTSERSGKCATRWDITIVIITAATRQSKMSYKGARCPPTQACKPIKRI